MIRFLLVPLSVTLLMHSAASAQTTPPLSFQAGATIQLPAASAPTDVAVGDFDHDGLPDVAVPLRNRNEVLLYRQLSAGSYGAAPVAAYPTGLAPSSVLALALENLPGQHRFTYDDLLVVSGPSNVVTRLVNTNDAAGTLTARPTQSLGTGSAISNPILEGAYIDADSLLDVVFTRDIPGDLSFSGIGFLQNRGMLTLRHAGFTTTGGPPVPPTTFDMNGGGAADVITVSRAHGWVDVRYTNPTNPLTWWSNAVAQFLPTSGVPLFAAGGNIAGDSLGDVAVALTAPNHVEVWVNTAWQVYDPLLSLPLPEVPRQVLLQDLNDDQWPELLVLLADGRVLVYPHSGQPGPTCYGTPQTLPTGPNPARLRVADADGDGDLDLLVACTGDHTLRIWRNASRPLATRPARLLTAGAYPNPATTQLRLAPPAQLRGPLTAVLLDAQGREVLRAAAERDAPLPVGHLPRGLYLLRLESPAGAATQRLLLQ